MRVTIIPADTRVIINGEGVSGIDMSSISPDIHAVQWYETWGEVEFIDQFEPDPPRVVKPQNELIQDLAPFQTVIDLAQAAIE